MSDLEEKRLDRLYELLRFGDGLDSDTAATLRWAIFTLEQCLK